MKIFKVKGIVAVILVVAFFMCTAGLSANVYAADDEKAAAPVAGTAGAGAAGAAGGTAVAAGVSTGVIIAGAAAAALVIGVAVAASGEGSGTTAHHVKPNH